MDPYICKTLHRLLISPVTSAVALKQNDVPFLRLTCTGGIDMMVTLDVARQLHVHGVLPPQVSSLLDQKLAS